MDKDAVALRRGGVELDDNCFDWIRIACALTVFLGHFLTHYQVDSAFLIDIAYFVRGVPVFFCLSGFFVARSVARYRPKEFFVRRFVRIYPAMWLCIAVNTAIILLTYPVRPTLKELLVYLGTQLSVFQFYTGDWLRGYGVGTPNGALWTITVDVQFYLLAYLLVKWLREKPPRYWVGVIAAGGGINLLPRLVRGYLPEILYKLTEVCILPFLYIFLFGMMVYFFRDRFLPVFRRWKWLFIGAYVIWECLPGRITGIFEGVRYNLVTTLLLMCAMFSVGFGFGRHRLKTDHSYAFYLWHMVVINFVYHHFVKRLGVDLEMFGILALVLAAIGLLAFLSVRLIDKRLGPALQKRLLRWTGTVAR